MALPRKSRTAMDVLKSNIEYISTYSKKIDDMLGSINLMSFSKIYFLLNRWWYSNRLYNRIMWKSWKWKIKFMVCLKLIN